MKYNNIEQMKCDICGKTKGVKTFIANYQGVDRDIEEDIREYIKNKTSKKIKFMPRLCPKHTIEAAKQIGSQ